MSLNITFDSELKSAPIKTTEQDFHSNDSHNLPIILLDFTGCISSQIPVEEKNTIIYAGRNNKYLKEYQDHKKVGEFSNKTQLTDSILRTFGLSPKNMECIISSNLGRLESFFRNSNRSKLNEGLETVTFNIKQVFIYSGTWLDSTRIERRAPYLAKCGIRYLINALSYNSLAESLCRDGGEMGVMTIQNTPYFKSLMKRFKVEEIPIDAIMNGGDMIFIRRSLEVGPDGVAFIERRETLN